MTPAQQVALDAMRSAWPEETVARMLRAVDPKIEAAVLALDAALHPLGKAKSQGYWRARQFIRDQGGYDGDLNDLNVLAEVTRIVAPPLWLALPDEVSPAKKPKGAYVSRPDRPASDRFHPDGICSVCGGAGASLCFDCASEQDDEEAGAG